VRRLNLRPVIRVESGMFIGYLEDQQYLLGSIETGVAVAAATMIRLCMEDRRLARRAFSGLGLSSCQATTESC
jgi:hypothetical protein